MNELTAHCIAPLRARVGLNVAQLLANLSVRAVCPFRNTNKVPLQPRNIISPFFDMFIGALGTP